MLRRPPTTLAITAEDVAAYEDRRAAEALHAEAQLQLQQPDAAAAAAPPRQVSPRRAREERIGVARRAGR
ncbi:anaphase-promoting complex APC subunit CDC26 domain-containing protein [Hirsutella rhossiliensis]|uniref:Anaphase-promoting complex APC subunit CDC26 domain-containing protein n=1 Tax=Hirsutella rhossiliensis TaxID=111463 RepID=A0A9P8SGW8_9HYPO|nr:anaphase-promoting complex APC subunit CDC26 domain-containing protein [Hirsutella rhossiliensis]KAH0962236.1 anaphase-promoting complex APC subunit CDC26 domain-containing protein [Hirsutella rhossiliensis]